MADTIIDTSILVDMFRGNARAGHYVNSKVASNTALLHPLVAAEIYAGSRNRHELQQFKRALATMRDVPAEAADWTECLKSFTTLFLATGIGWEDCLIAATSLRLETELATLNDKHFRAIPKLKIIRPY